MFICKDCGFIFEEPKKYSEDLTPGGANEGGSFNIELKGCPKCQGSFAEAKQCGSCEEWFDADDLTDTTEYFNGGCGDCCEGCIEAGDMKEIGGI